jgi:hypothetical protein
MRLQFLAAVAATSAIVFKLQGLDAGQELAVPVISRHIEDVGGSRFL